LDPAANPKTIDLHIEEFDLSIGGGPKVKIPNCTVRGVYKIDGDRLTICFTWELDGKRPTAFASSPSCALLTLAKAPADFKDFPREIAVKVMNPDGKPAAGVTVASFMSRHTVNLKKDAQPQWQYFQSLKAGYDGIAKVRYEQLRQNAIIAHDREGKR